MATGAQTFETHLPAFRENQKAPWGRLRYAIAFANLQRHLQGHPLRVLDVGGGNGLDAVAFAVHGHAVTLLDFSAEMLAEAGHNAQEKGVADRITFCQADLASIPTLFPVGEFDVILCHNVLQYVDDLSAALTTMCHVLRSHGLISILCVNRYSESYRQALQQLNPSAAYASLDAPSILAAVFGVAMRAYAADDMRQPLEDAGCATVGQYGVRCVCDYVPNNDLKSDPAFFAQLEQLEYAMSDRYPYYLLARFFQVIGRKTAPSYSPGRS